MNAADKAIAAADEALQSAGLILAHIKHSNGKLCRASLIEFAAQATSRMWAAYAARDAAREAEGTDDSFSYAADMADAAGDAAEAASLTALRYADIAHH